MSDVRTIRGPGRPALAEPRDKVVGVRFSRREIADIESAIQSEAKPEGQTVGEWLRLRALESIGR